MRSAPARPRSSAHTPSSCSVSTPTAVSVRIGGEDWSARAYMPDQVLEPGVQVEVAEISGATALVYE